MRFTELLTEAKAGIEHPEDLIMTDGSIGASNAVNALMAAATTPKYTSLKMDGSPAGIAGYWHNKFTLTDKRGFSAYDNGGLLADKELFDMMFNRFPDAPGRKEFSTKFSNLFPLVKNLLPTNFKGFIQFDVLWFTRPEIQNGMFVFQPNKVIYRVPVNSDLGKLISKSKMGIAIHSYFKSPDQFEPIAVNDISTLHLNDSPGLFAIGTKLSFEKTVDAAVLPCKKLLAHINRHSREIDAFLNPTTLKTRGISNLGQLMKGFMAYTARQGKTIIKNINVDFLNNLGKGVPVSENKANAIKQYIEENQNAYNIIWGIAVATTLLKNFIKSQWDKAAMDQMSASINGQEGHEGFVSDTPYGRIKFVNRPVFMREKL